MTDKKPTTVSLTRVYTIKVYEEPQVGKWLLALFDAGILTEQYDEGAALHDLYDAITRLLDIGDYLPLFLIKMDDELQPVRPYYWGTIEDICNDDTVVTGPVEWSGQEKYWEVSS